jgi:hypothetical protein
VTQLEVVGGLTKAADCECPCHRSVGVVHPTPCCMPCEACGLVIRLGAGHHCAPEQLLSQVARPTQNGLVHGLTRHDTAFAGGVALVLMGICVFSGTGTPIFVWAIGAGAVAAVVLHRSVRKSLTIKPDGPDPGPRK